MKNAQDSSGAVLAPSTVRRFSAMSGGGVYWVRDNDAGRLIAQCCKPEDAATVAGSLNQKDAYVEGFALMRDCLLHHHASRKGIRELVRKATEIVNAVPNVPGQGCCQILIQPNIGIECADTTGKRANT